NDGTTSFVTVNAPPTAGAFAGKPSFVEVIVEYRVKRTFSAFFTGEDLPVQARSVAVGRPAKIGLLMLRPNGAGAFVNKALALTVVGESVMVNSTDASAYNQAGLGVVIATGFNITGGYVNPGGAIILGRIRTGVRPTPGPLAKLAAPARGNYTLQKAAPYVINSLLPTTIQPGIYQGGINIKGLSIVTMNPGVYYLDGGGLQVTGTATVIGTGVTIYNTSDTMAPGPITINSLGKIALTAPASGTYQGIAIFQDRGLSQPVSLTGN